MNIKIITLIPFVLFAISCSEKLEKKDLYVNGLVYKKSDSSLCTGTLKIIGNASYYYTTFCEGVPCGEWAEYENSGGLVQKGKYLKQDILSKSTQELFGRNTFIINHWQESELPTILYPPFLTIIILKENAFFDIDNSKYDADVRGIANAVFNDTKNLKYDYLKIKFVNSVIDWNKEYSKEYKINNGKLL